MPWVILLSRVLMAAIFIHSGYGKAMHPSATTAMLAHYNLPLPGLAYAVTLLVEIGVPMGLVIASIHEKRDEIRHALQEAAKKAGRGTIRSVRAKTRKTLRR